MAYGRVRQARRLGVGVNDAKNGVNTFHRGTIGGITPVVNGKSAASGKNLSVVRRGLMDLRAILNRVDKKLAEKGLTAKSASRLAGRDDIFRVFKRAAEKDAGTNTKTLEALAAGLGVSEQWLIFGTDSAINADLETQVRETEKTVEYLKEAFASFLTSIGVKDAEAFVDSLEEIARTSATSQNTPHSVNDLKQQARGLSFQAVRQLRTKSS